MAKGKSTCKILKEIRSRIAEANDIEYVTSECKYKGDCLGTCPKCEAEVRYLEQQLSLRRGLGKAVIVAGLSAGMLVFSGCANDSKREVKYDPVVDTNLFDDIPMEEDICFVGEINNDTLPDENGIYELVDEVPAFPEGEDSLMNYISTHIIYPEKALEDRVEGRVVVSVVVNENGSIGDTKIIRPRSAELDKEAVRVVKTLPDFIPGKLKGKPVKVWFILPVTFRLPDEVSPK